MFIKKDGKFAVECQVKIASDCVQASEHFDSEDEALEWVEEECWVFSGEGWICVQCNEQIFMNIRKLGNP